MRVLFALTRHEGPWIIHIHGPHLAEGYRHVHITRNRLGGTYSWNLDGSRHDKNDFPANEKFIKKAKRIAERHLGVAKGTLSFIAMVPAAQTIDIHLDSDRVSRGWKRSVVFVVLRPDALTQVVVLGGRAGRIYVVLLEGGAEAETSGTLI